MSEERRGVTYGVAAYLLWGLFPLYWPHLKPATAGEILAHRLVWSFVLVLVIVASLGRLGDVRAVVADRRRFALLALAAVLISINWYVYIYGVNSGHVVETSLGYFVNPLVTVLLGVVVLHERLRVAQWAAVAVAAAAVVLLTIDYGRPPWIALALAFSFGAYGLVKKQVAVGAAEGLVVESGVILLPAIVFIAATQLTGEAAFGHAGPLQGVLMVGAGVVTAVPLLLFASSARRVPLVTLGLLQYLAPTLQFLLGVVVYDETMVPARWIGFALVWIALLLFTADQVRQLQRRGSRVEVVAPPA